MAKKVFTDESLATFVDEIKAYTDSIASSKVDKVTGKGLSTNDYTTTEKNKLSGIASGAQVNQNAFSNIAVSGQTTVAADTTTDTVTFAGSNVTITTDATNDKVTFSVADGSTSAKGLVQLTNSTSSTSTTTAATPSSVKSAYDLANTAKTNAATAQTRADAAYALAEGKVDSLSDLGITATATELNYTDGVTSNIQTQLDAKATTSALTSHTDNKSNPHGVTLAQLGVTATAAELNYVDGVTSNIQTQLNSKMGDFSIEIYNGTGGNPKPVRFASFNYSTCNSENGIAAKISLVSGHGNGTSYAFLEDAIIRVGHTGTVEVDTFKYYGADTGTYDGANRQYGDIFWLIDTTNKIVDFYALMGQYARMYQTPWKRLTYSTGGTVTQHTSCTVYSSGTKAWANNSEFATKGNIDESVSVFIATYGTTTYEDIVNAIDAGKKVVCKMSIGAGTVDIYAELAQYHESAGTVYFFAVGGEADNIMATGYSIACYDDNSWENYPLKPAATETWTFTLEDGSTVTKAVYVG